MSLDIDSSYHLDENFKSEVIYNSFGGINVHNIIYDDEKLKLKKPQSKFSTGNIEDDENIEINENLYNIERDDYGYFKPIEFNVVIPDDLESIPNSKVHERVHIIVDENDNKLRPTLPPGMSDKAKVMNYNILPTFHFTITQQPMEKIPVIKTYYDTHFNLNELADYKLDK